MPLSRQFRDTYWNNPQTGETESFADRGGKAPNVGDGPENHAQGMLFSPYHGTGLRQDPTVPHDERIAEIQRGLGLEDVQKYRERVARTIPSQGTKRVVYDPERKSHRNEVIPRMGEAKAKSQIDMVTEAADSSDMPMSVLKNVNAGVVVNPTKGRAWAHLGGGTIKLNEKSRRKAIQAPDKPSRPAYKAGDPLPNKSFSSAVGKVDWGSEEGARSDMHGEATFFDHTGKPYNLDQEDGERDFRQLPKGHSANVWPGTGKDTDKYVTQTFQVWNGTSYGGGGDRYRTFHTRHAAVPTGEMLPPEPGEVTFKTVRSIDRGTLVHEVGHNLDKRSGDAWRVDRTDPMAEALADGFADRFHRGAGKYEEALHPSDERAQEFDTTHSYGLTHHVWRGRSVDKALYAAVRQHVSMGDHNYASIPDRNQLAKDLGIERPGGLFLEDREKKILAKQGDVHQMLLGHMYDKHEHVREILGHLGLTKVGEKARSAYVERAQSASPSSPYHVPPKPAGSQWQQSGMFESVEEPQRRAAAPRRRRTSS